MNGSASRPSSATIKGTRWAIRPATKATSRENRSSLATTTLHFAAFAAANAAASCGRRSRASAPFPLSASINSADNCESFAGGKSLDDCALGVQAEARAVLALRGNPQVCNRALHDQRAYHRMAFGRSAMSSDIIAVFELPLALSKCAYEPSLRH